MNRADHIHLISDAQSHTHCTCSLLVARFALDTFIFLVSRIEMLLNCSLRLLRLHSFGRIDRR